MSEVLRQEARPGRCRYAFLVETYRTERLKTLGVWSQIPQACWELRIERRARTAHEHLVHQCLSEDAWMRTMLAIDVGMLALPPVETRETLIRHYGDASELRHAQLVLRDDGWFEAETPFFDVVRSRAWVLTRRIAHTAHHRGQLTAYFRVWSLALLSTYGPTADTGGLPKHGGRVIYPGQNEQPVLPTGPVTERPS